jgi:type VI secretion system ImpJ/VasE family protein
MKYQKTIHWHEGLFLQPHHMQYLQNEQSNLRRNNSKTFHYFPFGLSELELSDNSLENSIIAIEKLTAIMPSGIELSIPGNATVKSLQVNKDESSSDGDKLTVYLAIPLWSPNEPNTVIDKNTDCNENNRLYKIDNILCNDENTGKNPQPVLVRDINAFLTVEPEKYTDIEFIPILKIDYKSYTTNQKELILYHNYAPPCLSVWASKHLKNYLDYFLEKLLSYRKKLLASLQNTGYNTEALSGTILDNILRLRTINVYAARLSSLLPLITTSPFHIYLELRGLLGELAGLFPLRDFYDVPEYDHLDCRESIDATILNISSLITEEYIFTYFKIPFLYDDKHKCTIASLTEEHLIKGKEYYFAVKSTEKINEVIKEIEAGDIIKLTAPDGKNSRTRGIKVAEVRIPPATLPALQSVVWFKLEKTTNIKAWEKVRSAQKIALFYTENKLPVIESISLFITV